MQKRLLSVFVCVLILLTCIGMLAACNCEHTYGEDGICTKCGAKDPNYVPKCDHVYVDGVCTKCGESDPNYVAPKKDYDMSGIKFENKTVTFNGQMQTMAISGTLPQGVRVEYEYYSDEERTQKVTDTTMPGTYYVTAKFTGNSEGYNPIPSKKATLVVNKKDYDMSGIKFENKIEQYTGSKVELKISGNLPQGVSVTYVYATDSAFEHKVNEAVAAGTYYVKASFTGQAGYHDIADKTAVLTISTFEFIGSLTFTDKEVDYDGEAHGLEIVGTIPDVATVNYKYYSDEACQNEVNEVVNAGVYFVTATLAEKDNAENKEVLRAKLTIKKIDVAAIRFEAQKVDFDGEAHTLAIAGDLPAGATGVTYKYYSDEAMQNEVTEMINAGVYYVTARFTVDANHNAIADKTVTLTINQADVNFDGFNIENVSVDYNGQAHAYVLETKPEKVENFTYRYFSDANYQNSSEVEPENVLNAGTYYVLISYTTNDANYKGGNKKATLTVNKIAFEEFDEGAVTIGITGKYDNETESTEPQLENNVYTFEFALGTKCVITATATDVGELQPHIDYFRDANMTDKFNLEKAYVQNFTDSVYIRITYQDENHIKTYTHQVSMRKYTVELKTFDDLKLMRQHVYGDGTTQGLSAANRRGIRYVLMNDIDCQGKLWTPVTYLLDLREKLDDGITPGPGINGYVESSFVSEFDGQGHTISNYKITEKSFNADTFKNTADGILYVGFFGRVNNGIMYGGTVLGDAELEKDSSNIHDITFDNVNIKFDATAQENAGFYKYTVNNAEGNPVERTLGLSVGTVLGYVDGGNQHTVGRTNIFNVTVRNSAIDVNAYNTFVGGIVGYEDISTTYTGLRYNLTVDNCQIYAVSSQGNENTQVYIGGLVGRYQGGYNNNRFSGTPDKDNGDDAQYDWLNGYTYCSRYINCTVSNIKLGYNYEAVMQFNDEVTTANEALTAAQSKVEAAQAARDEYVAAEKAVADAEAAKATAQEDVAKKTAAKEQAQTAYDALDANATEEEKAAAEQALNAAKSALTEAETALTNAENTLTEKQTALEKLDASAVTTWESAKAEETAAWEKIAEAKTKQAPYLHVMGGNINVGLFAGRVADFIVTFKNCTARNYLIAHTSTAFYSGFVSLSTNGVPIYITGSTLVDGDWNNGMHGIYGVPNDRGIVSSQNINENDATKAKWQDGGWEWQAAMLNRKENGAFEYWNIAR